MNLMKVENVLTHLFSYYFVNICFGNHLGFNGEQDSTAWSFQAYAV